MVSAVKIGGRRLHELARQGSRWSAGSTGHRVPLRHRARPGPARRVPGRGGVLVGHLRPGAGPRPRPGPRRGRTWPPAADPHGSFGEDEMRPLELIGPDAVLSPAQAMRDSTSCGSSRPPPPPSAPASRWTGSPWAQSAMGRGDARRARRPVGRLRGDGHRPDPAGRRAGRGVTGTRLPSVAMPGPGTAVTIGAYDGVHLGHRALLGDLSARAEAAGLSTVVVTFDPPPRLRRAPDVGPEAAHDPGAEARAPGRLRQSTARWWCPSTPPGPRSRPRTSSGGARRRAVGPPGRGGGDFHFGTAARQRRAPAPPRGGVRVRGGRSRPHGRRARPGVLHPHQGAHRGGRRGGGDSGYWGRRTRYGGRSSTATAGVGPNSGSRRPTWPSPTTSRSRRTPSTPGTSGGRTARCTSGDLGGAPAHLLRAGSAPVLVEAYLLHFDGDLYGERPG